MKCLPRGVVRFFVLLLQSSSRPLPCHAFLPIVGWHRCTCEYDRLLYPQAAAHRRWTSLSAGRERRFSTSHDDNKVPASASKYGGLDDLSLREEQARQRRTGQAKQRLNKSVRREERISTLEERGEDLTAAEMSELQGLLRVRENFEEQYDPLSFTKEHLEFKSMHNDVLIALTRYCERERLIFCNEQESSTCLNTNVFFLDGPDAGTATALIERGNFHTRQCFVANRHRSTCDTLKKKLPDMNIVHATAAEALTAGALLHTDDNDTVKAKTANARDYGGSFSSIDFTAYYFDGCGGFPDHIINMCSAALLRDEVDPHKPIAVGYSLLGGNKDVVSKELLVSRALSAIARKRGMRMVHALDEPQRYGISSDAKKIGGSGGGGTFTTWCVLEPGK